MQILSQHDIHLTVDAPCPEDIFLQEGHRFRCVYTNDGSEEILEGSAEEVARALRERGVKAKAAKIYFPIHPHEQQQSPE